MNAEAVYQEKLNDLLACDWENGGELSVEDQENKAINDLIQNYVQAKAVSVLAAESVTVAQRNCQEQEQLVKQAKQKYIQAVADEALAQDAYDAAVNQPEESTPEETETSSEEIETTETKETTTEVEEVTTEVEETTETEEVTTEAEETIKVEEVTTEAEETTETEETTQAAGLTETDRPTDAGNNKETSNTVSDEKKSSPVVVLGIEDYSRFLGFGMLGSGCLLIISVILKLFRSK